MDQKSSSNLEQKITAALFAVVIFSLGILSANRWTISSKTISQEEKRRLASCPHLRWQYDSIRAFPSGFDTFFNDRFAYRKELLSAVNLLVYRAFAYSVYPKVLVGKNDWLFFLEGGDEETLRHCPLLSQTELSNWVNMFEARRAWLAARNIRYVLFFAPSKCSIYREEVPKGYTMLSEKSREDQVTEALRKYTRVDLVDVRPALIQAKKSGILYYKTDTHWNRVGSLIAYREVANHLKTWYPAIKPIDTDDLDIQKYHFGDGDLASMMGLRDLIPEWNIRAFLKNPKWHFAKDRPTPNLNAEEHQRDTFVTETDNPALPTAFCIRDSFMQMPQAFFSENFRRMTFDWTFAFPAAEIAREKPDVVVEEFYERGLARDVLGNPPEVNRCAHVELFAQRPTDAKIVDAKVSRTN